MYSKKNKSMVNSAPGSWGIWEKKGNSKMRVLFPFDVPPLEALPKELDACNVEPMFESCFFNWRFLGLRDVMLIAHNDTPNYFEGKEVNHV
ncbi:MAG TPA: hypothetical protein VF411_02075 [Bacteroidia bacterium]